LFPDGEQIERVERRGGRSERVEPTVLTQGPEYLHERGDGRARAALQMLQRSDRDIGAIGKVDLGELACDPNRAVESEPQI